MPEPEDRAFDVLAELLEVRPESRAEALASICAGDPELREAVAALLEEHERMPTGFLAGKPAGGREPEMSLPERIGEFRIIRRLGQGGMGIVYEAEQASPRRRVALKVVRPMTVTASELKRFGYESQILAQLNHPGIAHVYGSGVADTPYGSQPYFAMELILGVPLDRFVREHDLGARDIASLVASVADAVQAAHEIGVVHRDLKPANILVTGTPGDTSSPVRAKVVDFGVARASHADGERSIQTETGHLIGTLSYMSPEQISGRVAVDARSDVYALGVVLYLLLAGRLPHDLRNRSITDAISVLGAEEPTRLGTVNRALRGDLETIIAKALEKDPDRRYATASALAEDLRRFVKNEAISARPPSYSYQLSKFARRHRPIVLGVLAAFLALSVGLAFAVASSVRANRNEDLAVQRGRLAEAETYRASISAAGAALRERDIQSATTNLERCPEALRGWEWDYFSAQLDRSIRNVSLVRTPEFAGGPHSIVRLAPESDNVVLYQAVTYHDTIFRTEWDARDLTLVSETTSPKGQGLLSAFGEREMVSLLEKEILTLFDSHMNPLERSDLSERFARTMSKIDLSRWIRFVRLDPSEAVFAIAINPYVVVCRGDSVDLIDAPEGAGDAVFSRDGNTLYIAGNDRSLSAFDVASRPKELWRIRDAHRDAIHAIALSPDGNMLATGSEDATISLWDARTKTSPGTLLGHSYSIRSLAFSRDGAFLYSTDSASFRQWSVDTRISTGVLGTGCDSVKGLGVSPDGATLLSGSNQIDVWDAQSWTLTRTINLPEACTDIDEFRFGLEDGKIGIASHARRVSFETSLESDAMFSDPETRDPDSFQNTIIVGPYRVTYRRGGWDAVSVYKDDRLLNQWEGYQARFVALSPDGRVVAIADRDIAIFDTHTGERLALLTGHTGTVHALVFHPDGSRLVSGSNDRSIRLWDTETWTQTAVLHGHVDRVWSLAFSPNGDTLFSGSGDRTVRAWTTRSAADILRARHDSEEHAR